MRIFKIKGLEKFTRHERIADVSLEEAIARAERGIIDADLGGGLIKQRVARLSQGRSGGYRMMIAFRTKVRAIFLIGFAKNERENITTQELTALRALAKVWLLASERDISNALSEGVLHEVTDDKNNKEKIP